MRASAYCGLAFILAGCCTSVESPGKSGTAANSSGQEECGDCCANPSRSALLEKTLAVSTVNLKTVKADAFLKDLKAQTGKVVCLYQWASDNAPSMQHLADAIALQEKFGGEGLVCMTLSMDLGDLRKETFPCLQQANCALPNYLPHEKDTVEAWDPVFGCCGQPYVVIYGRNGKQAASFMIPQTPLDLASIEKAIVKELNTK